MILMLYNLNRLSLRRLGYEDIIKIGGDKQNYRNYRNLMPSVAGGKQDFAGVVSFILFGYIVIVRKKELQKYLRYCS